MSHHITPTEHLICHSYDSDRNTASFMLLNIKNKTYNCRDQVKMQCFLHDINCISGKIFLDFFLNYVKLYFQHHISKREHLFATEESTFGCFPLESNHNKHILKRQKKFLGKQFSVPTYQLHKTFFLRVQSFCISKFSRTKRKRKQKFNNSTFTSFLLIGQTLSFSVCTRFVLNLIPL